MLYKIADVFGSLIQLSVFIKSQTIEITIQSNFSKLNCQINLEAQRLILVVEKQCFLKFFMITKNI